MRSLLRRDRPHPTAVHARVHDGSHLWIAVRDGGDAGELTLIAPSGEEWAVPTRLESGLHAACAPLPSDHDELRVVTGRGRRAVAVHLGDLVPAGPTLSTPPTPDGSHRWDVEDDSGALVLRRHPVPARVPVRRIDLADDAVRVHLDPTAGDTVVLRLDDVDLARVDVLAGVFSVPADVAVPAGATATFEIGARPLARDQNLLTRPHPAVVLPSPGAGLELRWLPDARLAVQRPRG